jgi:hypothetical protein
MRSAIDVKWTYEDESAVVVRALLVVVEQADELAEVMDLIKARESVIENRQDVVRHAVGPDHESPRRSRKKSTTGVTTKLEPIDIREWFDNIGP